MIVLLEMSFTFYFFTAQLATTQNNSNLVNTGEEIVHAQCVGSRQLKNKYYNQNTIIKQTNDVVERHRFLPRVRYLMAYSYASVSV